MKLSARIAMAVAVVVPPAAVGTALFTQHVLGMTPCAWCVLQRMIFLGIALVALPGFVLASSGVRRASALGVMVLAGCGVAAALWQHFVAASAVSCNLSLADRIVGATGLDAMLPDVFAAWASCADAKATLLGAPYEFYSLTLFTLLTLTSLAVVRRPA